MNLGIGAKSRDYFRKSRKIAEIGIKIEVLRLETPQNGPWRAASEGSQMVEMRRFKILDGFLGIQNGRFGSEKQCFSDLLGSFASEGSFNQIYKKHAQKTRP